MEKNEPRASAADARPPQIEPDHDCGRPLLIEWMDSDWFQVWLKLARHEEAQAA